MKTNNEIPMYPVIGPDGEVMYAPKMYGLGACSPEGLGIIEDVVNTGKEIVQAISKIKDIGKPAPGLHHRKLASAINYFSALGYSVPQMQQEPIRSIIAAVGGYEARPINEIAALNIQSTGVRAPLFYGPGHSFEKYILSKFPPLPTPVNPPGTYMIPPDGNALDRIVQSVFGPIPPFGVKLSLNDLYTYAPGQTVPVQTVPQPTYYPQTQPTYQPPQDGNIVAQASAGQPGNNLPPGSPGSNQMLFLGLGVAALVGLYGYQQGWFGTTQKAGKLSGARKKTRTNRKR